MKSISITRLKPWKDRWTGSGRKRWNEKYLDYEIETCQIEPLMSDPHHVEIKSISITRLKLYRLCLCADTHSWCWNQKYLDYEIETQKTFISLITYNNRWNEKYLDYEIETYMWKRSYISRILKLKSKVSRLRDWNNGCPISELCTGSLEIKSISITRLKPLNPDLAPDNFIGPLKSKVSRLRDWNDRQMQRRGGRGVCKVFGAQLL